MCENYSEVNISGHCLLSFGRTAIFIPVLAMAANIESANCVSFSM
jgi:hypothetical protein